jgi:hypothetical protein
LKGTKTFVNLLYHFIEDMFVVQDMPEEEGQRARR